MALHAIAQRVARLRWKRARRAVQRPLRADPLNAELHHQAAQTCFRFGRYSTAIAELKTAEFLGFDSDKTRVELARVEAAAPPLHTLHHLGFYRNHELARELKRLASSGSVLDVGGGDGTLARFLDGFQYCLAEPGINGIAGEDLPFADKSFDFVVSCHVLEHIPIAERTAFLDNLAGKARRAVVLLNPYDVPGTHVEEQLQLVIDVTDEQWAREHLACSMPRVEHLQAYAEQHGLRCTVKPSGSVTTDLMVAIAHHFAKAAGRLEDFERVSTFYNQRYLDIVDSPTHPASYVVTLEHGDAL
jgi:hypothetical protein